MTRRKERPDAARRLIGRLSDPEEWERAANAPKDPQEIPDSIVIESRSGTLLRIRCADCGATLKGVRQLGDGRYVIGAPWKLVDRGISTPLACNKCGSRRPLNGMRILEALERDSTSIRI